MFSVLTVTPRPALGPCPVGKRSGWTSAQVRAPSVEKYADPRVTMVSHDADTGITRVLDWEERFTYYRVIMDGLHVTLEAEACEFCGEESPLCSFHGDEGACRARVCTTCIAVYSFRSRAQNKGHRPVCPWCRIPYRETDLILGHGKHDVTG